MKTIALFALCVILSGCGGGDARSPEVHACDNPVATHTNLTVDQVRNMNVSQTQSGNSVVVKYVNKIDPATGKEIVFATCTVVGGVAVSITLSDGTVVTL